MGTTSKLNRDPGFINELIDHGVARAEEFVAALAFEDAWRSRDVDDVLRRVPTTPSWWSARRSASPVPTGQ